MQQRSMDQAYSFATRAMHWIMAGLFLAAFSLVWLREAFPKGDVHSALFFGHQWAGLLILLFFLPRLVARSRSPSPSLAALALGQRILARSTEGALYLMMVAQPLMGWFTSNLKGHVVTLFGFALPSLAAPDRPLGEALEGWHKLGGWLILALLALHITAALYHHFWRRDGVLDAMLGSSPSGRGKVRERVAS